MNNTTPIHDVYLACWPSAIEVYPDDDTARRQLARGLRRTRQRSGALLAELLEAARESNPDAYRLRVLADGVEFESQLAGELAASLAALGPVGPGAEQRG